MKKYKFHIISMLLVMFTMFGCEEQEIADPISPDGYPTATFTTDFTGTEITEGDKILYTITLDKMLAEDIIFTLKLNAENTVNENDISYPETVTIVAYSTEATFEIIIIDDNYVELDENLKFELGVFDLAKKYLLNPNTKNPVLDLTVKSPNPNSTTALTVGTEWPNHDDDWDIYIFDRNGTKMTGNDGATGADPELNTFLNTAADGTYYVELDAYAVEEEVTNFAFTFGKPDGTIEVINLAFNMASSANYPVGEAYRAIKIEKVGTTYTCTAMPEY